MNTYLLSPSFEIKNFNEAQALDDDRLKHTCEGIVSRLPEQHHFSIQLGRLLIRMGTILMQVSLK